MDKEIFAFRVLWDGWKCDSAAWAWVMEREDGTRYLQMTDHGSPYEADPEELIKKIAEYRGVIARTERALELLKKE